MVEWGAVLRGSLLRNHVFSNLMATNYRQFAGQIRALSRALAGLEPLASSLGVAAPTDREWFELLQKKLLAQVDQPPLLVVAIVGGTNIGKSVIFNHLAGEVASGASPLAAGTKHPVCLTPPSVDDPGPLERLFEGFRLQPWRSAADPLEESPQNRLFWRRGPRMPERLLLLDAPDIDSDVTVNWQRARAIRQASDLLLAVLTQQKYNDAAVKQFFRAAAEADKPVAVLFNQCDLAADRTFWPQWLETFCEQTGVSPELVYVAPYDRSAAEQLRLPFYPVGSDGKRPLGDPVDLRDELAGLHFDAIKIRTFRGALRQVLQPQQGLEGYLAAIRARAEEFSTAAAAMSAREMARVAWPGLPAGVLVEEIRCWWDSGRKPWSRRVHGFYRRVGRGLTWPLRTAWQSLSGPRSDPLLAFQEQERRAVMLAVEKSFDQLERLARVGNDTLRPRLAELLRGERRVELLRRVQTAHEALPAVDDDYRAFLTAELDAWRQASPRTVRFLQSLDHAWAIARPTISVVLFVSSWGLAGGLVGQAGHAAGELATEAAIAGGITGGGEALVSTTSEGIRQAAARLFRRLQSRYAQQRAQWLACWLEKELLGDLLADLRKGAEVPKTQSFENVQQAAQQLRAALAADGNPLDATPRP